MTSQSGAGVRDRSTLRLVITRSVTLRNTLIYKGAERTRLMMDIHTGAQPPKQRNIPFSRRMKNVFDRRNKPDPQHIIIIIIIIIIINNNNNNKEASARAR